MAMPFLSFVMYYPWMARKWYGSTSAIALIPCLHTLDPGVANSRLPILAMEAADAVLPSTTYEKQYLVGRGVPAGKIEITGPGIHWLDTAKTDPRGFRSSHGLDEDPLVVFLGRVEEVKGVWFLMEAMLEAWAVLPSARLVIAGTKSRQTDALRARASGLPRIARERTTWLLDFPEEQKPDLLAAADVVALPSVHESFGMAFLEAWLFGKPVVGCRIGAVSAVIEDCEDGFLVTPGDRTELAHTLLRLLISPSLRRRFGERGRRKALEHHTWDRIVDRIEAAYEQIADRRQR
jgi:glycosyltransferase involved in cell wall biosynthesis